MTGQILPGDEAGIALGFTLDLFDGWLWDCGDAVYVSMIISLHESQGNFNRLLDALENKWPIVKVPTPSRRMKDILKRRGYVQGSENTEMGLCEVWSKTK